MSGERIRIVSWNDRMTLISMPKTSTESSESNEFVINIGFSINILWAIQWKAPLIIIIIIITDRDYALPLSKTEIYIAKRWRRWNVENNNQIKFISIIRWFERLVWQKSYIRNWSI